MNRRDFLFRSGAAVSLSLLARPVLWAQAANPVTVGTPPVRPPPVVTEFKELRRGVGLFTGRGGTIGWLSNADALVAVDTQFPETAAKFLDGLPGRVGRSLDAVINTHHHADHTSGNATLRPATRRLVAHQNVPALQQAAAARAGVGAPVPTLPDTIFPDSWRLQAGDEEVSARYFGPAHTGGDIVVHFERANIVHTGDLVFNRLYPVMNKPDGVRVRHWITVLEQLADHYPADALFIFGHGSASFGVTGTRGDVLMARDFLAALVSHVEAEKKAGKPREEIVKLANLPGWDAWHAERNSRLPGNLGVVFDELAGA